VVVLDLEGMRGVAQNLDAARPFGFDPDGRVRLADVPKQRSDMKPGHGQHGASIRKGAVLARV